MRDSRLPKKIDKTKLSFPSSSSSSSTRKARNFHNVIHTTRNQNKNNRNNYNNKFAMIYTEFVQSPGEKNKIDTKRRGGRDFSPSVGSQHSSSATSCATDTTNTMVYVRDSHYVWLPAQIQSMIGHEEEEEEDDEDEGGNDSGELSNSVLANIVLPDDWVETTDLHNESSITELEYYLRSNKRGKKGGKKFGFGRLSSSPKRKTQIDCDNDAKVEKKDDRPIHQKKRRIYHYEKESGGDGDNHITAKGVTRTVHLKHYAHGALPLQNVERKCRGQMKVMTSIFSGQHSSSLPCPQIVNARDMADLAYLHEAAILYNLKLRHADKLPYTRVGDIVVAVNPFQWINGLYSSRKQALYASHLIWNVKDVEDENASRDYKKKHKKKSTEMCASGEDSADCASISSDFDESSTINSLPKDDVEIKHQPMVHGSYYSRLGLEPHVYETASLAYRGLASDQQNQTILVSGISGAGKTETVKIVMSNLATIEQTRPFYHGDSLNLSDNDINVAEGVTGIVQQLLESNPVFEAFGCAKTIRNDNSSRFGRFTQLQFQVEDLYDAVTNSRTSVPECILVGSSCQSFLLEKSRIISHAPGERLFHIFYQLLASPEEEKVRIWKCLANTTCETFTYLGTTPTSSIKGVPDREAWRHTVKALKLFGFDGSLLRSLMRSLCIVLQLGNLTFEDTGDDDEGSEISSSSELSKLAKLIGIPESSISIAMSRRVKTIGGEEVIVKLNQIDAKNGCDALAKAIYSIIFDKLVEQINEHTSVDARENCDDRNIGTISLLDIFGFDKFDTNRFEQLCINYANERLQQRYVLDNFRAVKEEYTAEGIDIFDFKMVDNSSIVNLLGSKSSIISCLNEECLRPQGSAESFVFKIKSIHGDKPGLLIDKLQDECEFGVKHFAGPVTYDAASFLKVSLV
jgi:myosin heavy subunit